ncbi:nickel pincer cofactor biosynthesis protein LarB [Telmatocola sphagniphila]|uniref:Nickel pincer cofactor biosynthesis protein LarB n=1 Tax=Telmatocola sphagniphila TaxID=1123043 RepID=A0A8E6B4F9_9BACT|nr:nickel pincer cofactor biosynthesis protein LarB [Telmatocola sphagniphila]QVL31768.1 nickel pincer cofactor biosynthesis protein LarB [Telmatocola sphagniphila]
MESHKSGESEYATLDLKREARCGFPEVIFAEGKTVDWMVGIINRLIGADQDVFATRVNEEQASTFARLYPQGIQDRIARTFWLPVVTERKTPVGDVLVITAGTSDLPVAREALNTASVMGVGTELIVDVGVAGLHRILSKVDRLRQADIVIVVAGMDGALPSVVGGLVDCAVIAVPTSIGYGAAFQGLAPLLTMLNACSAAVVTVNIDAGFKAGYTAARIVHRMYRSEKS